jgi:hypothetical protein
VKDCLVVGVPAWSRVLRANVIACRGSLVLSWLRAFVLAGSRASVLASRRAFLMAFLGEGGVACRRACV